MEYEVVTTPQFTLLGLMERLPFQEEDYEGIWKRFMAYHSQIEPLSIDKAYYGAYSPTADRGPMDYLAGMLVPERTAAPERLTLCQVPAGRWAVFECTVATIPQTYDAIFGEWLPTAPYEHVGPNPDAFERYPPQTDSGDTPVRIHIRVRERGGTLLNETMASQTRQAFKTLRTAIEHCPDGLWRQGTGSYLVVARLAFHALEAIDYHLDPAPGQYQWGKYGLDWEGSDAADLWDRARTVAYLEEMLAKALAYVDDPSGLLSEDVHSPDLLSRLDHLCYALRHLAQHTGEINALLRQANAPVGNWL